MKCRKEHAREAAGIIAVLLNQTIAEAERQGRHLYDWEIGGIKWLRKQWEIDPTTFINLWIANRYVLNTGMDLDGKMSVACETITR